MSAWITLDWKVSIIKLYVYNISFQIVFIFSLYRLAWTIFVASAFLGAIYVSILLSEQYNTSPLSTVVESTYYHVSEVAFPGVTICNNNRINYKKVNAAIKRYIFLKLFGF